MRGRRPSADGLVAIRQSDNFQKATAVPGFQCPDRWNCFPWGLDKATLSLCAAGVCKLVLAEAVRDEVEENLLLHAERLSSVDAGQLIEDYRHLIKLTRPELVSYPPADGVRSYRHLIRHAADVPILLSAMASKPDWLLTHNIKHFTQAVAHRTGQRIATPAEFFRVLATLLR